MAAPPRGLHCRQGSHDGGAGQGLAGATAGTPWQGLTYGAHRVVPRVLDALVSLHAGIAQWLRTLHAVTGGRRLVLAAGAALGGDRGTLVSS